MDELEIQKEIVEPRRDPALDELKERLMREHEEKEKKARWEVEKDLWTRILLQEESHALILKKTNKTNLHVR